MPTPTAMSRTYLLLLILLSATANAGVYKCKGPTGATVYSQFPCAAPAPAAPAPAAAADAPATPAADAKSADCPARTREIDDRFSEEAAAATGEIRRLREQMSATNGYSADARGNSVRAELEAAEKRLEDAGRTHQRALVDLRKECDGSAAPASTAAAAR